MTNRTERPNITPEWSALEKVLQIVCILMLICYIALFSAVFGQLPSSVPTHFNIFGTPDSYGSKNVFIMYLIMTVGIYIVITILERFPRLWNLPFEITEQNAKREYQIAREMAVLIKTEIGAIFTYMLFAMTKMAKCQWQSIGSWFEITSSVILIATIVLYIIRMFKRKSGE